MSRTLVKDNFLRIPSYALRSEPGEGDAPDREPIQRERLSEKIARNIALRIFRGDQAQIQLILKTEVGLSKHLRVSRSALREAIRLLAAKGLVEVHPKTGIYVRPRLQWNLLDPDLLQWQCEAGLNEAFVQQLCQVRLLLEPGAAELAAREGTPEEIQTIHALYKRMDEKKDNFEAYLHLDIEFHRSISRAVHNDVLIQINQNIFWALQATQTFFRSHRDTVPDALEVHGAVAEAILKRDPEGARLAMTRLVQQAQRDLCWVLNITSLERSQESGPTAPSPLSVAEKL